MTISVTAIWDTSLAFIRREAALLVPLALATLGIGDAAVSLIRDTMGQAAPGAVPAWLMLALAGAVLLTLTGQLAIIALALGSQMSVGEALARALARLPKLILISCALGFLLIAGVLPLAITLASDGYDVAATGAQQALPLYARVYLVAVLALTVWIGIRMVTINALVIDRNPPMLEAVRDSYRMTAGRYLPILGVLLLYLVVLVVMTAAVSGVVGSLFSMVGKLAGAPGIGPVMAALATAFVSASLGLISNVYIAKLYQALVASPPVNGPSSKGM